MRIRIKDRTDVRYLEMTNKKLVTIGVYIPLGMCRSVEPELVPENRHPVRDASLTGCRNVASRRFLPNDVFLTEYVSDKQIMMQTQRRNLLQPLQVNNFTSLSGCFYRENEILD